MKKLLLIVQMLIFSSVVNAAVIQVPSEYPTIQAGINVALEGDTVLVADGSYTGDGNRDIDFKGKEITVMSENGALNCVINCEGTEENNHRGFYFHTSEGAKSIIEGFTIENGFDYFGGGITCTSSSPTVTNCNFLRNTALNHGGAIHCISSASPSFLNCLFSNNSAEYGGGVFCNDSSPAFNNCTFSGNSAQFWGGGIVCFGSSPIISNCTFEENSAPESGGGISSYFNSDPYIIGCMFIGNTAGVGGGIRNSASSSPIITNCIFLNNIATQYGGGFFCTHSDSIINNCTFNKNTAMESGGALSCSESFALIRNCIFWDNVPIEIHSPNSSTVVLFSNIQNGYPGIGNINKDPIFIGEGNHPFKLSSLSPCIDTGTDQNAPQTDMRGSSRPRGGAIDMGAYEYDGWPLTSRVYIRMPSHNYLPGDLCYCNVDVWNAEQNQLTGYPLFAVLNIFGSYYWAPGFTNEIDNYILDFPPGLSSTSIIPGFIWPEGAGSASGIVWYAGLANPEMTELVGEMGVFDFGWSE